MKPRQIKNAHDRAKTIIDIIKNPSFSNIVPELVRAIITFLNTGSVIGELFLQLNKANFMALDAAIKAAQKNWPVELACHQMAQLMTKLEFSNKKAISVLGEVPHSMTIQELRETVFEIRKHVQQLDQLIDKNFQMCEALVKLNVMIKRVDAADKDKQDDTVFDFYFWQVNVKQYHKLNIFTFKTRNSNSVDGLLNHRNKWAKWAGISSRTRPRNTYIVGW